MTTRRQFLAATLGARMLNARPAALPKQIRAFCIDFNWYKGVFAPPGHWAGASPEEHVGWYEALGANTIQTFCVSCNGYAWYKGGFVPPQPGLQHDFLTDVVRLGHQRGMLVMGYFCVGANSKWGQDHPDLSYGVPGNCHHIPFTDAYLDYLCALDDGRHPSHAPGRLHDRLGVEPARQAARERLDRRRKATVHQAHGRAVSRHGRAVAARQAVLRAARHRALLGTHSRRAGPHQSELQDLAELQPAERSHGAGLEAAEGMRLGHE